jgi:hypothetical protein
VVGGGGPVAVYSGDATTAAVEGPYERLRSRYSTLTNRQDQLQRMWAAVSGADGFFKLVDPPTTSDTPMGPNRSILVLFALALAGGLALLFAASVEAKRFFHIQDDRDVRYFLGAPVLAAIPETLTPVERRHRRTLKAARTAGVLALAAGAIPVLIFVFNALRVFELLANR